MMNRKVSEGSDAFFFFGGYAKIEEETKQKVRKYGCSRKFTKIPIFFR